MPLAVVTVTSPVVAPVGTVAVAVVPVPVLKTVAAVPLKRTPVTPVRPVPVSVTLVPTGPLVGKRPARVGTRL